MKMSSIQLSLSGVTSVAITENDLVSNENINPTTAIECSHSPRRDTKEITRKKIVPVSNVPTSIPPSIDWRQHGTLSSSSSKTKSYGIPPKSFHQPINQPVVPLKDHYSNINDDFLNNKSSSIVTTSSGTIPSLQYPLEISLSASLSSFNPMKHGRDKIQQLLHTNDTKILKLKLAALHSELEFKRTAYKQVTECVKYPFQQPAINHWKKLQSMYLNDDTYFGNSLSSDEAVNDVINTNTEVSMSSSSNSSSSSSNYSNSKEQQKRRYVDFPLLGENDKNISPSKIQVKQQFQHHCKKEQQLVSSPNKLKFVRKLQQQRQQQYEANLLSNRGKTNEEEGNDNIKNTDSSQNNNNGLSDISIESTTRNEMILLRQQNDLWSMEPRIFAIEGTTSGTRKYMTCHIGRFYDYYFRKLSSPVDRHAYELLLENTPCRLYFDIEYNKNYNAVITDTVAEIFLSELYEELSYEIQQQQSFLNVSCEPLQRSDIVDLEASTTIKFSRHWIVHMKPLVLITSVVDKRSDNETLSVANEVLFVDTIAVGRFVQNFVGRLVEEQLTGTLQKRRPTLHKHLFVSSGKLKKSKQQREDNKQFENFNTNDELVCNSNDRNNNDYEMVCMIDLGVYTRNRIFRLMGSTKFGKGVSSTLRIAATNQFKFPAGFDNNCLSIPPLDKSNATNSIDDLNIDSTIISSTTPSGPMNGETEDISDINFIKMKTDWSIHAEALACTLVVPVNVSKLDYTIVKYQTDGTNRASTRSKLTSQGQRVNSSVISQQIRGTSPYPMLDEYIRANLANRHGVEGIIQSWSVMYDDRLEHSNDDKPYASTSAVPKRIVFLMLKNRYCECVGRQHRSNNIMWNVDLYCGPPYNFYQTCWDVDCRRQNFRGKDITLPSDQCIDLCDILLEEQLAVVPLPVLPAYNGTTGSNTTVNTTKSGSVKSQSSMLEPQMITSPVQNDAENLDCNILNNDTSFELALAALNLDEI